MPNSPAQATRPITVQDYVLTIAASKRLLIPGASITFTGNFKLGTVNMANERVYIILDYSGTPWFASGLTDSNGNYSITFTMPFSITDLPSGTIILPCHDWNIAAYSMAYYVYSSDVKVAVAYNTRIRSFTGPDQVGVGGYFTTTGYLEYESPPGTWVTLVGKAIKLFKDSTLLTTGTTDSNGRFTISSSIGAAGTFTLKASYEGEGMPLAFASATAAIMVNGLNIASLIFVVGPIAAGLASILQVR